MRDGRTLLTVWVDPAEKKLFSEIARREGKPLSVVIKRLLGNWAKKRQAAVPITKTTQ